MRKPGALGPKAAETAFLTPLPEKLLPQKKGPPLHGAFLQGTGRYSLRMPRRRGDDSGKR